VTIKVIIFIPIKEYRFQISTINPNKQKHIKSAVIMDIPIDIDGNDALDTLCSADGTDGSSWSSAHVIENCVIDASKYNSCIKIKNTDRYLIIKKCTVINSKIGFPSADGGIKLVNCTNVNITNCRVNNNFYGICLFESKNNTLWGNNVSYNNRNGIYLYQSNNNTLLGNNALRNNESGIYLEYSYNNIFLNNIVMNNSDDGIFLERANNNILSGNLVSNNSDDGISLERANNNILSGNLVSNNSDDGIDLYLANNSIISNNNAFYNKFNGIRLRCSDNNTISGNNASYNGNLDYYCYGIKLSDSDYNEVYWNSLDYNYYNTEKSIFDSGKDNYIHDNNFIDLSESDTDTEPFPLLSVAIVFFIIFMIILIFIIIGIFLAHIDRRRKIGLGVLSGFVIFCLISIFPLYNYLNESSIDTDAVTLNENQIQIIEELSQVCERKGINNATAYTNASGPHFAVLLDPLGRIHNWTKYVPEEWWPNSMNDAELVIRVGDEGMAVIQVCDYLGPDITRYQLFLNIQLLEVKTGEIIANTTLYGSEPRECKTVEHYSITIIKGSSVSLEQLKEWVEPYIIAGV